MAKEQLGERVVVRFLAMCEEDKGRERVLRMVRHSVAHGASGRRFYRLTNRLVFNPLTRTVRLDNTALRVELATAQLFGLAVLRYVAKVEPIASLPTEEVVRRVAPVIQHHLTGSMDADL
jgi:hypothetical protein